MELAAFEILFSSEDDSSDSDSDSSFFSMFGDDSSISSDVENNKQNPQTITDFVDVIHDYSESDFKLNFRLQRSTAQICIDLYSLTERFNTQKVKRGLQKTTAEKEIYVFLWYMANTDTFRQLSNLFGLSISTGWNIVKRVTKWVVSIAHEYVKWPTENEANAISVLFEEKCKIPGVVGAIDATHIRIKTPTDDKERYLNHKRHCSISLQAVVDVNQRFINIFCGEPGGLDNDGVLRRSDLYRNASENKQQNFYGNQILLGDSSYPCLDWLITPFENDDSMTTAQRQFNHLHSTGHAVVKHSFRLLKTRFRRLVHFTEQTNINLVVNLTVCCCVLHNICINNNDQMEHKLIEEKVEGVESTQQLQNHVKRQQVIEDLIKRNIIVKTE